MNISVLQWNIWYKEDIKNIASFLLKNKADIICLQELMHNYSKQRVADTAKYIAEALGYNYYEKVIEIEGEPWQQANGIFTRFPIIERRYVWINKPIGLTNDYDNEYRAYVEVVLDISGALLTVGTTHMSYTDRFMQIPRKKEEANQLVDTIRSKKKNYILTGDFNAEPQSYTIKQIRRYLKNVGPPTEGKTWTTKPFLHGDFHAYDLTWRLDYIFASDDIEVIDTRILKTKYSDHLPIFATVKLNA